MTRSVALEELKPHVEYDPDSGVFTWRYDYMKMRKGKKVGNAHSRGYVEMCVAKKRMFAHQAAWLWMTGEWPTFQIDHINGNRADNRWSNLRRATQALNSANMRKRRSNKSGFKGVVRRQNSWHAYIHVGGKTQFLGSFETAELASEKYIEAARSAWGDFARAG